MHDTPVVALTKSADKLSILVKFSYEISQENRLGPLLSLLATEISRVLNADRSSVFIYDRITHELWSIVAQGLQGKELRFPADKGIIGYVLQTGQMVNIDDAYQDFRFNPESDKQNNYLTKTVLAMPLKDHNGNVLGVFQVLNKIGGNFDREDEGLLQLISLLASAAIENAQLYESLRKSHYEMILRLAKATQYRDKEDLEGHLRRMSKYAAYIAEAIGMSAEEIEMLREVSPLHDIGKIAIPDKVLLKGERLTEEEYELMKQHPAYGAKILANPNTKLLEMAYNVAYSHHEKYDGTGYPRGLKGDEIPLEARIVALADVFDALLSKRTYKEGWSIEQAVDYIKARSNKQFDPKVVDAFIKCLPVIKESIAENHL